MHPARPKKARFLASGMYIPAQAVVNAAAQPFPFGYGGPQAE
jgi:hypothetical protein